MASVTTQNLESLIYNRAKEAYEIPMDSKDPPFSAVYFGPIDYSKLVVKAHKEIEWDQSLHVAVESGIPILQTVSEWTSENRTSAVNHKKISAKFTSSSANVTLKRGAYFGASGFGVPLALDGEVGTHFGGQLTLTGINGELNAESHEISVEDTITIPSYTTVKAQVVAEIKQFESSFKVEHSLKGDVRLAAYGRAANNFIRTIDGLNLYDIVKNAGGSGDTIRATAGAVTIVTEGSIKFRYSVNHRVKAVETALSVTLP